MWTKSRSVVLSQILVWLFMVVLVVGFFILPMILGGGFYAPGNDYGGSREIVGDNQSLLRPFLIGFRISIVPAFIALVCLHFLLRNIRRNKVFVFANVSLIRIVSWCCFITATVFLFLGFAYYYASGLMMGVLMAFLGLVLRVLKNVFAQAVEIKTENDLTV